MKIKTNQFLFFKANMTAGVMGVVCEETWSVDNLSTLRIMNTLNPTLGHHHFGGNETKGSRLWQHRSQYV